MGSFPALPFKGQSCEIRSVTIDSGGEMQGLPAKYKKQRKRNRFPGFTKKADSEYQGIRQYDRNIEIHHKNPRGEELTAEQKDFNRKLLKKRKPECSLVK
ncbi:hypothetical protein DENIS_0106 [Desulfonema ishimotonii]|uniref:Uncharacterized protein n=1 Tax=Desulfonema ishimotonii TaxID=45657 RepID=A0A401FQD8_9BACT|nr:hypothetical protein DENIS_0106 [Desulfonema ishimotonii]